MEVKYYQKLKCRCKYFWANGIEFEEGTCCGSCKGSGITKGADITETIKLILEGINNQIEILIKNYNHHINYGNERVAEGLLGNKNGLQKAKQIIEENVIKVEE